nr:GNAT family N-acetyltransferase [Streptomyces sp. SID8352]
MARTMLTHVLRALRADGLDNAVLDVDAESPTGALGLYQNLGFTITDRAVSLVKRFWPPPDQARHTIIGPPPAAHPPHPPDHDEQKAPDVFPSPITDFWLTPSPTSRVLYSDDVFSVTADTALDEDERLTILTTTDRKTRVLLTPAVAEAMSLEDGQPADEAGFRQRLEKSGISLHGADNLFYFTEEAREALLGEPDDPSIRPLTEGDAQAFEQFEEAASEHDLDDASVELDHWAVYGVFDDGRLVCVASMYPWDDAPLADLGVLTLPPYRGKGHARRLVRAISRHALARGHEPQYRCQLNNHASVAAATSAGLTRFGTWDIISPDSAM